MEENVENVTEELVDTPEVSADDIMQAETVFFVIKDLNGAFRAITDVSQKLELARTANLNDIYSGCRDIVRAVDTRQTAEMVVSILSSAAKQQTQE